jgi:hypothetical protein
MPIRINLLAEAQAAEEMRRKDPVKRSIWIGGFVVFVVLLASATLQFKIIAARAEVTALEGNWKKIEKDVQEVNDHRNGTRELEKKLSAIDQFTTNRMLWAKALDALQHTPVQGIQLVHLRSEQTFALNEPSKTRTNSPSAARGPTVTEKTILTLEGKDYTMGDKVQEQKQSLAKNAFFEAHLQKTNKIQLTSLSAPQTEGNRAYRAFGFQLFFEDKERYLHE